MAEVVQRLVGHAAGHRPVADDRDDRLVPAARIAGVRQSERHRQRVARVPGVEGIVGRLAALREPADASVLAQRPKALQAPRQELVDVGLVADVEDDPVGRALECSVDPEREFHSTEVGGEMPTGGGNGADEPFADLGCAALLS